MCGILGIVARSPVNQLLYDGLLLLQHRGQDAAGIVTSQNKTFHMQKGTGMVQNVFRTRNMRSLPGNMGIAHCRYPTAGSASNSADSSVTFTAVGMADSSTRIFAVSGLGCRRATSSQVR